MYEAGKEISLSSDQTGPYVTLTAEDANALNEAFAAKKKAGDDLRAITERWVTAVNEDLRLIGTVETIPTMLARLDGLAKLAYERDACALRLGDAASWMRKAFDAIRDRHNPPMVSV